MNYKSIVPLLLLSASLFCAAVSHTATDTTASADKTISTQLDAYLDYLDAYPAALGPWGDAANGEIEIVRDKEKIAEIEQATGRKAGVVSQDKYWLWVNDPVKFPNGKYGIYGRILWVASLNGTVGVAVMPMLPNGKIALNRNFRHATRSWEYELPRGGLNLGETIQAAALREVKEETGMALDELHLLGNMAVDTGFTNSIIPIFLARVISQEEAAPGDSEAIAAIEAFTVAELKQGFIDGYLTATVEGKPCRINLRDPFLSFAFLHADLQSLLPKD